jgi:multidrug efflux pump subunit AcrA (membrane-fusion protein)
VSARQPARARSQQAAVTSLFRPEAVEASRRGARPGAPLRLSPGWTAFTYRFVLLATAVGLIYATVARVGDHARGPAVVRVEGRLDLTTATGGVVLGVDVEPGETVQAGQTLVRFHTDSERQELEQLEREFEMQLVRILLHPADAVVRQSLASLRAARELVAARLRERLVLAPQAGVARNLRIRPGQLLAPGDVVLTLVDESEAAFSVVALVPGQFRPMLERGMKMRFSLEGYPQVAVPLPVEAIADEAVGPGEARRYLGRELGDTLPVEGSLVLVRARLPARTFTFDGRAYRYYDGIPGQVDIQVRTERLIVLLFPFLKAALSRGD